MADSSGGKVCIFCCHPLPDDPGGGGWRGVVTGVKQELQESQFPYPSSQSKAKELPGCEGYAVLNEQLRVYFILAKLLRASRKWCTQFVSRFDCDELQSWFRLCGNCEGVVCQGMELYSKILVLQRGMKKLGEGLGKVVRQSWEEDDGFGVETVGDVPREIRRMLVTCSGDNPLIKTETDTLSSEAEMYDSTFILHAENNRDDGHHFLEDELSRDDDSTGDMSLLEGVPRTQKRVQAERNDESSDSDYLPENNVTKKRRKSSGRYRRKSFKNTSGQKSNVFDCDLCDSVYTTIPGIRKHQIAHSKSKELGNKHDCHICRHPNLSEGKLRRHMTTVHGAATAKTTCKVCGHFSHNKCLHEKHMLTEHNIRLFTLSTERHCSEVEADDNPLTHTSLHFNKQDFRVEDNDDLENQVAPCNSRGVTKDEIMVFKNTSNASNSANVINCDLCESVYTTIPGIRKHMVAHEKSKELGNKFDCPTCRHPNLSEGNLRRHITKVHETTKNTCTICGQFAHSRLFLEKHMLIEHNVVGISPESSNCDERVIPQNQSTLINPGKSSPCSDHDPLDDYDEMPSKSTADKSMKVSENRTSAISNDDNVYRCELCESIYTTIPGINKHNTAHEKSKELGNKYDCPTCRHPNLSEGKLRRHITRVHGSTKNTCKICGYFAHNRTLYEKHMRIKHRDRKCTSVSGLQRFGPQEKRKFHKKRITKENASASVSKQQVYNCDLCESVYTSIPGIRKHKIAHEKSDELGNKYDCHRCRHPNLSEEKLRRHITKVHETLKNTCHICGRVSHTRWVHERHMFRQHNIRIWTPMTAPENEINIGEDFQMGPMPSTSSANQLPPRRAKLRKSFKVDDTSSDENDDDHSNSRQIDTANSDSGDDEDWLPLDAEKNDYENCNVKLADPKIRSNSQHENVSMYTCNTCKYVYKSLRGYSMHQEEHQRSAALNHKFDCECGFPCSSEKKLRYHKTRVHQKSVMLECKQCNYQTVRRVLLRQHMRKHHYKTGYNGNGRPRKYYSTRPDGKFDCSICCTTYLSSTAYSRHVRNHESSQILYNGQFDCNICHYPCTSEHRLRWHKSVRHGSRNVTCDICDKTFPKPYLLKMHLKSHHEQAIDPETGKFRCRFCLMEFVTLQGLQLHKGRLHKDVLEPSESFLCSDCGHCFNTPSLLRRHVKTKHENNYKYNCEVCGKGFEGKSDFTCHMVTHQENRVQEFVCEICGVAYSHQRTLSSHKNKYHRVVGSKLQKQPRPEGEHKCRWCNLVLPYRYALLRHIQTHKEIYNFKCEFCEKSYTSASSLKLHVQVCHSDGQNKYPCKFCGKVYIHKHYVICHYKFCRAKNELLKKSSAQNVPSDPISHSLMSSEYVRN